MPTEAHLCRSHDIFWVLCIMMMRKIVPRYIIAHWMAIGQGQKYLKHPIGKVRMKDRAMNRVVDSNSSNETEAASEEPTRPP